MSPPVAVTDLEAMERPELLDLWREVFGRPAPKSLSRPFLCRFLAFELQSRRHGGLPARVKTALDKGPGARPRTAGPALKPGGRLLREWNGTTHVVDVTEDGFRWNGQTWRSLSVIARAITGAHWSGPRFFGIAGKTAR